MPNQVVPIQDIAKAGIIMDTPSVSLPPNVFNDALNVRFDDSAIRKMEGENAAVINVGESELRYVAWWPHPDLSPDNGYYVVVYRNNLDDLGVELADDAEADRVLLINAQTRVVSNNKWVSDRNTGANYAAVLPDTQWQHTLFGGGRTFILNNGTTTPRYITDDTGDFFELPGWDSYLVDETVSTFIWDFNSVPEDGDTPLGVNLDLTSVDGSEVGTQRVVVTIVPADTNIAQFTTVLDQENTQIEGVGIGFDDGEDENGDVVSSGTDSHFLTFIRRVVDSSGVVTTQGIANGDTVNIQIQTLPAIQVRAKVIKTFGNLLVAGNLTEMTRDTIPLPVRNMPGLIRTSDVAAAGNIPANWNPFHTGVNTADEFTLSSTGIVQDMAELQGVMFVYTNNSIHSIQATGNANLPYNVRPVAEGYGAQTINAVREFDGKHVVIGSNDIYVFSGHPGSIQSISDGRVRKYFFDNLDPMFEQNLHTLLNRRQDELWINFPHSERVSAGRCTETLIWNYRDNTWTRRRMSTFYYSDVAPLNEDVLDIDGDVTGGSLNPNIRVPILVTGESILQADQDYTLSDGMTAYQSYVQRNRLAITPEFDTETLASIALLTGGTATLDVDLEGTNTPGGPIATLPNEFTFDINTDYKVDVRIQGRFLNYRIGATSNADWELSGMQYEIRKGGQR